MEWEEGGREMEEVMRCNTTAERWWDMRGIDGKGKNTREGEREKVRVGKGQGER